MDDSQRTNGAERTDTGAAEGADPPPSVSEMVGRRVTVRYEGEDRPATVVESSYARNSGDVMIAVELDESGGEEAGAPAGERIVVGEDRVSFD